MRRGGIVLLVAAGLALALLAERQAYELADVTGWLPDLAAGTALLLFGARLIPAARSRTPGLLLVGASLAWFAPDLATTGPAGLRWVLARLAYLHRGPLLALALALPDGRARTRSDAAAVGAAWVAALVWPIWSNATTALVAGTAFAMAGALRLGRARGPLERSSAGHGLLAVIVLAAPIAAGALQRLAGGHGQAADAIVVAYAGCVLVTGAVLYAGARILVPGVLAEQAVVLGRGGARLRDVLRELLGDPTFAIGIADTDGVLVDEEGRPYSLGRAGLVTPVEAAGRRLAMMAHAPGTLDDPATRVAVASAVGLTAERVRLQLEIDRQVDVVAESRRRLAVAADDERRRLAVRLERSVGAALEEARALVDRARAAAGPSAALDRAELRLSDVEPELDRLVAGLSVADTAELLAALGRLAADAPLDVRLELVELPLGADAAAALWFVCSESLANAAKHSGARSVVVDLAKTADAVRLTVTDDGRGGADPGGSGLTGLADRLAALGGRMTVSSPPGGGTCVVAELPQAPDAEVPGETG